MKLDNTLFWHDAGGCHWCGRNTDSMTEGHDGMCPVPLLVLFEAENEKLREVQASILERAERVKEGEQWNLAEFVVKKIKG